MVPGAIVESLAEGLDIFSIFEVDERIAYVAFILMKPIIQKSRWGGRRNHKNSYAFHRSLLKSNFKCIYWEYCAPLLSSYRLHRFVRPQSGIFLSFTWVRTSFWACSFRRGGCSSIAAARWACTSGRRNQV